MKKLTVKTLLLSLFTASTFMSLAVFADVDKDENPSNYKIMDVVNKLKQENINTVTSIEFDNNVWEIEIEESRKIPSDAKTAEDKFTSTKPQIQQTEKTYNIDPKTLKCTLVKTEAENDNDPYPPKSLDKLASAIELVSKQYENIKSISYDDDSNCWEVNVIENNNIEKEIKVDIDGTKILSTEIDD